MTLDSAEITPEVLNDQIDEIDSIQDEAVFSVDKMASIIETGIDAHRSVILFELQQLLEHCFDETIENLIPVLCKNVPEWSLELQISSAQALIDVVNRPIPKSLSEQIAKAAFRIIEKNHTEDSFEAWGEILVAVLPHVDWDGQDDIQKIVVRLNELAVEQDVKSRKLAARVFGSVAVCMPKQEVENLILKRALILVDDVDIHVRGMIAESLAFVGAALDMGITINTIWPKLEILLEDPDTRIHAATLRTIAHIIEDKREKHGKSEWSFFSKLLPAVFMKECEFARQAAAEDQRKVDDNTYLHLEIISEVFGPLVHATYPFITDETERKDIFKAYFAMATCNGPIIRRYCTFNLPAVALSLIPKFKVELSGLVEYLSRDPDTETRWNLAAGIHETVKILMGKGCAENLLKTVINLLQDENSLVRINTVEHFYDVLFSLTEDSDTYFLKKLTPVFQNLTLLSEGNWRTQELLANQLEQACELVPVECLRVNILPLLYNMAEESTCRVRKAAMSAISKAIWCIPYPLRREDAAEFILVEWAQGGVYWMRSAFIDFCQSALDVYSGKLFLQLFSVKLLELSKDNVPNVRLKLARIMHKVAFACQTETIYQEAIERLRNDSDKDVRECMEDYDNRILEDMKNIDELSRIDTRKREKEDEMEKQGERSKLESRRKSGRYKVRSSLVLPKIVGINNSSGGTSSNGLGSPTVAGNAEKNNEHSSPVSVMGTMNSPSAEKNSLLSGLLSPGKGRRNGSKPVAVPEPSSPRSAGRKALQMLIQNVGGSKKNRP